MFFKLLNKYQRSAAASCILLLGILQIALDSWTLFKLQQHAELIFFLNGNAVPGSVMHDMTYKQALSYFSRLKPMLSQNTLKILDTLQMTTIMGIVAGILQIFSSTISIMWKGGKVDVFWLVMNFIVAVLLSVAVSFVGVHMIRDVPYHQMLLTVTGVNLFISGHIWILNFIALLHSACFGGKKSESAQTEANPDESPQISSMSNTRPNTQTINSRSR